jgi:spermidine/putrescine transport system ATP-binding protein
VTHDQEEAMTMSDTIAVMRHGKIEQIGPPAEVYENPMTEFVANFLGRVEPAGRRARGRRTTAAPPISLTHGGTVQLRKRDRVPTGRGPEDVKVGVRPEKITIVPEEGETVLGAQPRQRSCCVCPPISA